MSAGSKRFGRAITQRKRQQEQGAKAIERANKLRQRQREERAALCAQTADGLNPNKRAALLAAQRRAEEDPRAKAMVERAEVEKRVRDTRKIHGIGEVVRPVTVLGEEVADPAQIPMSVAQRRAQKKDGK
jgi:predicted flap endonuclease-1-like 5' DNA nuclease